MELDNLTVIGAIVVVFLVMLMAIGLMLKKLYRRASKEISFVRTGCGGQRVIMNGGSIVLPVLHEIIPVNMNTLRLEVVRSNEQALITKDRMRVDVTAEFYVRVKPTEEAIADAAQTLGRKTMNPHELKKLVEGKFVDALRSVAAEMKMEELHEQRVDFVQKVQCAVTEDLLKNGCELETVSLTGLDQTGKEFFNPDNAFDAQGLTRLTEEIEARRKQRNDIEQDTEVAVRQKNLDAEKLKLELGKEEEYANLRQEREIEIRRASQVAEIAQERAVKKQEAEQADILAHQEIERSRITAEQAVEEQRISMEQLVREKDISRARAVETAEVDKKKAVETSKIVAERAVEEERIEKERLLKERDISKQKTVETAEVEKDKTVEIAMQDQAIAVAIKSKEQSEAQAEADKARALSVKAEERVVTVREEEKAERDKTIELVEAAKLAQREAIGITVAAEAERRAAADQAEAVKTLADAESEKTRIHAEGEAQAEILKADAAERRYSVEAEGKRARHEADNKLSKEQIAMQIKIAVVQHLAGIIEASVKPMEAIDGIKIFQLDGLPGSGNGASNGGSNGGGKNLAEDVVSSALKYRAQAPLLDSLLGELGLSGGDLQGLTSALKEDVNGAAAEEVEVTPSGGVGAPPAPVHSKGSGSKH